MKCEKLFYKSWKRPAPHSSYYHRTPDEQQTAGTADKDYIDRQYLSYLNLIEKINCCYCGYFTGLIGYVQEIAARTEQYWCPIKHAHRTRMTHSRYKNFLDYGDGEGFRAKNCEIRNDFDDLDGNQSLKQ